MRYAVIVPIVEATGYQLWHVEAETEDQARALHDAGKSTFDSEEFEIQLLGEPSIELESDGGAE